MYALKLIAFNAQNFYLLSWCVNQFTSTSADEKAEYDATGAKIYLESCETLGIVPASYFLRTLQAQDPQINMSHHGVGPKGAKAIAVALTVSHITGTEVVVSSSRLTDTHTHSLGSLILQ